MQNNQASRKWITPQNYGTPEAARRVIEAPEYEGSVFIDKRKNVAKSVFTLLKHDGHAPVFYEAPADNNGVEYFVFASCLPDVMDETVHLVYSLFN